MKDDLQKAHRAYKRARRLGTKGENTKRMLCCLSVFSTVNDDFYLFDTDILLEHSNGAIYVVPKS